jgi:hypothetical protein
MSEQALDRLVELLREEGGLTATLVDPGARAELGEAPTATATATATSTATSPAPAHGAEPPVEEPAPVLADRGAEGPAQVAAAGPRAEGRRAEYELLVETIYEGYLLHYGTPRVVRPAEADLGLLAGDRLYAIGLSRLVALEDAAAVAELADTITLSALAHAQGEQALAAVVWEAGARAVGWGSSAAHRRAKELVLAGSPEAIEAMRTSAGGLSDTL